MKIAVIISDPLQCVICADTIETEHTFTEIPTKWELFDIVVYENIFDMSDLMSKWPETLFYPVEDHKYPNREQLENLNTFPIIPIDVVERRAIVNATRLLKNREKIAIALGIGIRTLSGKLRSYGYPQRWEEAHVAIRRFPQYLRPLAEYVKTSVSDEEFQQPLDYLSVLFPHIFTFANGMLYYRAGSLTHKSVQERLAKVFGMEYNDFVALFFMCPDRKIWLEKVYEHVFGQVC
ncbi:MAG: hypothetical protein KGI50_05870 [Patescibacteria group bacterium]|nr:hypothetical protein [Patescibacteria group bacterium]MDE2438803.1 hypothetical protein [Patescibacteria group bacterium]